MSNRFTPLFAAAVLAMSPFSAALAQSTSAQVHAEQLSDLQNQIDVLRRTLGNSKLGTQQQINDGIKAAEARWVTDSQRGVQIAAREAVQASLRQYQVDLDALVARAKLSASTGNGASAGSDMSGPIRALQDRIDALEQQQLRASLNPTPVGVVAPPEDLGPRIKAEVQAAEARILQSVASRPQAAAAPSDTPELKSAVTALQAEVASLKAVEVPSAEQMRKTFEVLFNQSEQKLAQSLSAQSNSEQRDDALKQLGQMESKLRSEMVSIAQGYDSELSAALGDKVQALTEQRLQSFEQSLAAQMDPANPKAVEAGALAAPLAKRLVELESRMAASVAAPAGAEPDREQIKSMMATMVMDMDLEFVRKLKEQNQAAEARWKALEEGSANTAALRAELETNKARVSELEATVKSLMQNASSGANAKMPVVKLAPRASGRYLRYPVANLSDADAARAEALVAFRGRVELVSEDGGATVEIGPIASEDEAEALRRMLDPRMPALGTLEVTP